MTTYCRNRFYYSDSTLFKHGRWTAGQIQVFYAVLKNLKILRQYVVAGFFYNKRKKGEKEMKKICILLMFCLFLGACADYKANKIFKSAQQQEQQYAWNNAESMYELILENYPRAKVAPQAQANRERCRQKQKEIENLLRESKDSIDKKEHRETIQKLQALLDIGLLEEQRKEVQRMLEHSRKEAMEAFLGESNTLMDDKKYEDAIERLETLLNIGLLETQKKEVQTVLDRSRQKAIEELIGEANALIEKRKNEDAVQKLESVLKIVVLEEQKDEIQSSLKSLKIQIANDYDSRGGAKNEQKAFILFKELAEQGDAYSQYSVGFMLENGQGTSKNLKEAEVWYRKAATQELKKLEKILAIANKTADRKSYSLYHFLGKNVDDVLRLKGGNYDGYDKDSYKYGNKYICYFWGNKLLGGHYEGMMYVGGYTSDTLYVCHKKGSKTVVGVGYRYPTSNYLNIGNLPKIEYELPKSFLKLKYSEDNGKRIYSIGDEKWEVVPSRDMAGNTRVVQVSIFRV